MHRWLLVFLCGCGSGVPDRSPDNDDPPSAPGPSRPLPSVVINEVMPGNASTVHGPDGTSFPDWVELVNVGDEPVAWSRLALRDADGGEWEGGDGTFGPGERRLLWADVDFGFALDKDGDTLTLSSDGEVLDVVQIEDLPSDVSLARAPDRTGPWVATARPTPDAENEPTASATLDPATETVFTTERVHRIDFGFTPEAYQEIGQQDRPSVHVTMEIDGVRFPDIGLKLKGGASYNPMTGKPAFMADLNEWTPGAEFRSLRAFKLHNGLLEDLTRAHEDLTYLLARESGLLAPRVGWAEVYCNDVPFGLYVMVERHDEVLIEAHLPEQREIGVMLEPNEGFYDFDSPIRNLNETTLLESWEEGPLPPDPAVFTALMEVDRLLSGPASDDAFEELWVHVDEELFHQYLAWEAVTANGDGYMNPNNYRLFVNGTTHQVQWVPSGAEMTWAWGPTVFPAYGGSGWKFCMRNDGCRRTHAEVVLAMADRVEDLDLSTRFHDVSTWLEPVLVADPRAPAWWLAGVDYARQTTAQNLVDNVAKAREQVYDEYPDLAP